MSFTCLTPIYTHGHLVPCGKCGYCLQKRSLEWQFRLTEEAKQWNTTSFITLTYSPEFEPENGVDKDAIQKFLKRLRKQGVKFKYYATSEYGPSSTHRPHYHILFFHDLMPEAFYEHVEKAWPFGIISIGDINENRVAYCANYHISKAYNPDGKNENFCIMSKKIGAEFLTDARVDFFQSTGTMYVKHYDGYRLPMPRYFKKSLIFSPDHVQAMKQKIDSQSLISDSSLYSLLKVEERVNKLLDKKLKKRNHI